MCTPTPRWRVVVGAIVAFSAAAPAAACADEIAADPGSFGSAFSSAKAGDTIVLSAGDYGTFAGGMKSGNVTIKAASGAVATMRVRFNPAANITLDGLSLGNVELTNGATKNITVRGSTINGQTVLRTGYLQNANILFEGNFHPAWDKCDGCGEGRVWLPQKTAQPSGITIKNSRFGPGGDSDGIQNGSRGTRILNNEFVGLRQLPNGRAHVDSIQLYGSSETVIHGNYFHDSSVHIMAPDGGDHEAITDNVFVGTPAYRPTVQLGSHVGTRFEHNTVRNANIHMDSKSGNSPSRDGVLRDNVMINGSFNTVSGSGCAGCTVTSNLMGGAIFVGGANPTTFAGHALAASSPGKNAATDGTDQGVRIGAEPGPPPGSTPLPGGPGAAPGSSPGTRPGAGPAPGGSAGPVAAVLRPSVRLLSGRRALVRRGVVLLRLRLPGAGSVALAAKVRGSGKAIRLRAKVVRFDGAGRRTVRIRASRDARRRIGRIRRPQLVVRTFADTDRRQVSGRFGFALGR